MRCELRRAVLLIVFAAGAMLQGELVGGAESVVPPAAAPEASRQNIAAMPAGDKKELQGKQERFYRLDEEEQNRLRRLHDELSQDPDAKRLEMVLERYRTGCKRCRRASGRTC